MMLEHENMPIQASLSQNTGVEKAQPLSRSFYSLKFAKSVQMKL